MAKLQNIESLKLDAVVGSDDPGSLSPEELAKWANVERRRYVLSCANLYNCIKKPLIGNTDKTLSFDKFGPRAGRPTDYTPIVRENERFESYYNGLGIVPEEERQALWDAMKRDLPNSFRFTGSRR